MDLSRIPAEGERVELSFVGNHSYGTAFYNFNHFSDDSLISVFDSLCSRIEGFYFGRFDLRCKSPEALKKGEFKILELNGVGSEPLHIFDPKEKLSDAYSSLFHHWNVIYTISRINRKSASSFMSLNEAIETYKKVKQIQRTRFTIGN